MKCDSQASLLARIFACPCDGHEPKAKIVTLQEHDHEQSNPSVVKEEKEN